MARYVPRQSDTYGARALTVTTWSHMTRHMARPSQMQVGMQQGPLISNFKETIIALSAACIDKGSWDMNLHWGTVFGNTIPSCSSLSRAALIL